jgi:hypothetical protein
LDLTPLIETTTGAVPEATVSGSSTFDIQSRESRREFGEQHTRRQAADGDGGRDDRLRQRTSERRRAGGRASRHRAQARAVDVEEPSLLHHGEAAWARRR